MDSVLHTDTMYHRRSRSRSRVERTPHAARRRSRSEPPDRNCTPYNDPIAPPPIVVSGKHRRTPLLIFGEVHNDIDNRFYENLDLRGCTVFVEHATVLSEMSSADKERLLSLVKGIDWIWYKHSVLKRQVQCIDIRIEIGLPTAIEEQFALKTDDLAAALQVAMKTLRIMLTPKTQQLFEKTPMEATYTRLVRAVREQMEVLLRQRSLGTPELMLLKWKMLRNLILMASLMVDLHVVDVIRNYRGSKPIVMFMGAAHAYRLHTFYPKMFPEAEWDREDSELKVVVETLVYV